MSLRSCLVAATIFSAGLIARADTITTFTAAPLSGTITIDTTAGAVTTDSLSLIQNGTVVDLTFGEGEADGGTGYAFLDIQKNDAYYLLVTATSFGSIVGYNGGTFILSDAIGEAGGFGTLTPIATPSAVPEPSTLLLLGTGALTLAGAVRRRISL